MDNLPEGADEKHRRPPKKQLKTDHGIIYLKNAPIKPKQHI
jgi:hypothetical protein